MPTRSILARNPWSISRCRVARIRELDQVARIIGDHILVQLGDDDDLRLPGFRS